MTHLSEEELVELEALLAHRKTSANAQLVLLDAMPRLLTTIRDLRARVGALTEALTPSAETKAAYIGEFSFEIDEVDEDGGYVRRRVTVPWDTTKEIMKAILERALPPVPEMK